MATIPIQGLTKNADRYSKLFQMKLITENNMGKKTWIQVYIWHISYANEIAIPLDTDLTLSRPKDDLITTDQNIKKTAIKKFFTCYISMSAYVSHMIT